MRTAFLWLLIAIALLAGAIWWIITNGNDGNFDDLETTSPTPTAEASTNAEVQSADSFSMDEVEKHNSKNDCWFVINEHVYDVTSFISKHPGGDVIAQSCGTDATKAFETQGGEGSHSQRAENLSEEFIIGDLAK